MRLLVLALLERALASVAIYNATINFFEPDGIPIQRVNMCERGRKVMDGEIEISRALEGMHLTAVALGGAASSPEWYQLNHWGKQSGFHFELLRFKRGRGKGGGNGGAGHRRGKRRGKGGAGMAGQGCGSTHARAHTGRWRNGRNSRSRSSAIRSRRSARLRLGGNT